MARIADQDFERVLAQDPARPEYVRLVCLVTVKKVSRSSWLGRFGRKNMAEALRDKTEKNQTLGTWCGGIEDVPGVSFTGLVNDRVRWWCIE